MSTKVKNPAHRASDRDASGYKHCNGCGQRFTTFGLPRHWSRCPGVAFIRAEHEATRQLFATEIGRRANEIRGIIEG